MSSVEEPVVRPDWFDRASDWCNPILVKEVRQALKSRAFVTTFLLLLLGSWMISAFGLLAAGAEVEYGRVGQAFFIFYFGVLCVALGVVVPFGAFRSLLNERDDNTYELLSITSLSPGQIVRGKWTCAVVQSLLFYSAITPFIAFTSLLQGFNFPQAAVLLVGALYVSAALSITTLMLSTTVRQRVWQGFLSLAVISALLFGIVMALSGLSSLMVFQLPLDAREFWWSVAFIVVMSASYQWLFYQIAASRLTFESENRSTGIRLTAAGQLWLLWGFAALYQTYASAPVNEELIAILIGLSGAHLAILGLSFSAEPDGLSRRVRRSLPKQPWLRPFLVPLMPGGARGYLFVLLHLVALWLLATVGWAAAQSSAGDSVSDHLFALLRLEGSAWNSELILFASAVCLYIAIYSGIAACFLRWGQMITPSFQGAHARTMIVILVAAGFIVPVSVRIGRFVQYNDISAFDVFFPFWFLIEIFTHGTSIALQMWLLVGAAAMAVGLNVPAMARAIHEVLAGPHQSSSRPHPAALRSGEPELEPAGA